MITGFQGKNIDISRELTIITELHGLEPEEQNLLLNVMVRNIPLIICQTVKIAICWALAIVRETAVLLTPYPWTSIG